MKWYTAFGLVVRSQVAFPELPSANEELSDSAEITIRTADLPLTADEPTYHQLTPDEVCFERPQVGTLLVRDGTEILVRPHEEVDEGIFRLFVLGFGFGMLFHQRGRLVLHGSALAVEGQAIVFLGSSGAGKSTTAAALANRGHAVLADDLAVVRTGSSPPVIDPAFPALKLHPRIVDTLDLDWPAIADLSPIEKRYYRPSQPVFVDSLPVSAVYLITVGDTPSIEPVEDSTAMMSLVANTYANRVLEETDTISQNFHHCSQLVRDTRIRRLQRTKSLEQIDDVVTLLERDIGTSLT